MLLSLLEIGFDHLNKLELLHPEMNLTQWFWKWKFLNAINVFCYYFPFGKGCGPSFEQTETLHTKVCYVPRLVDIGSMVLEMKFFKYCQCIFTFLPLSPLGKRESTFLLKTSESPLPKCKVWLKLAHAVVYEKNMKSLQTKDRRPYHFWRTKGDQNSSPNF